MSLYELFVTNDQNMLATNDQFILEANCAEFADKM
jgi:hypothetical protein